MITVYGTPPTRALRVIWLMEEMGLDYEVRPVDFAKRSEDLEFLAVSPAAALPGIRDGDVRMMESVAILEYITTRYGPSPLAVAASDPEYPAYLQFLHYGEASLAAPLNVAMATRLFAPEEHKQNWGAQVAIDMVVRRSIAVAAQLKRTPYLAGSRFTAADISCGWALRLARFFGFEDKLDPVVSEYLAALWTRPAYERAAAKGQSLGM